MVKNNCQRIEHLISVCKKNKILPIKTQDGKIAICNFSLSKYSMKLLKKVRNFEPIIRVFMYGPYKNTGQNRCKELGFLLRSEFPKIKCDGVFDKSIDLAVYRSLNNLTTDEAIQRHIRSIGIIGNKNPIKPQTLDQIVETLNIDYAFKYVSDEKLIGDESRLFHIFYSFCEKPYIDFLVNNIFKYLGVHEIPVYSNNVYMQFNKELSNVPFSSLDTEVSDKEGFIVELLKSIDIKLLGIVDYENFCSKYGFVSKREFEEYVERCSFIFSFYPIFAENLAFPNMGISK